MFRLLTWMPPNGGRVEENVRSLEGGQTRGLRIPLVPADQDPDPAETRVEGPKAEVTGREVVFLEIEGIVRDVHLAVQTQQTAVGVEDRRSVVINARRPALEQ